MKNKERSKKLVSLSLVSVIIIACIGYKYFVSLPKGNESKGFLELSQAPIWASLQTLEFSNRKFKNLSVPTLSKLNTGSGVYDVLGVSGKSKSSPYVWIVLNINAGINGIFSMPNDESFDLSCQYLKTIKVKVKIDKKVEEFLRRRCVDYKKMGGG